jgi:hypothetical protein
MNIIAIAPYQPVTWEPTRTWSSVVPSCTIRMRPRERLTVVNRPQDLCTLFVKFFVSQYPTRPCRSRGLLQTLDDRCDPSYEA